MRILWVVVDLTGPTEGDVVTVAETPETPTPSLAERLEAEEGHPDGGDITLGDLRAAAAQLRQQDAKIASLEAANALLVGHLVSVDDLPELTRPPHPHSASLFMAGMLAQRERDAAQLRQLDRIKALGPLPCPWLGLGYEEPGCGTCEICRLRDALEADDGA